VGITTRTRYLDDWINANYPRPQVRAQGALLVDSERPERCDVRLSRTAAECLAFNWPGSLQAHAKRSLHQVNQTATGCGLPSTANHLNITGSRTNEYACSGEISA
jgi:hypothetical protein